LTAPAVDAALALFANLVGGTYIATVTTVVVVAGDDRAIWTATIKRAER